MARVDIFEQYALASRSEHRSQWADDRALAPVVAERGQVEPVGQTRRESVRVPQTFLETSLEKGAGMEEAETFEQPVADGHR